MREKYLEALVEIFVERFSRINWDFDLLSTLPEVPLEHIYKQLNRKLGVNWTLEQHISFCKKLHKLGYLKYSYGGISIVKGKKAEKHWIKLKGKYLHDAIDKIKEISQKFK